MKLYKPYLQVCLISITLILLAVTTVPDTAASGSGALANFTLSTDLESAPGVISAREDGNIQTTAAEPWTLSRMEAAQAYPLPEVNALPQTAIDLHNPQSEPVYIPSVSPALGSGSDSADGDIAVLNVQSLTGYDYPAPYTRYENFDSYQVFPYSTIGVLFFTQRGIDYRCSAAVVGENSVWTAGHCVHDGTGDPDGWSDNVVFIPAYKDGIEPYGRWEYFDLVTRVAWYNTADLRYDMGGIILNPNGSGKSVQEIVGSLGFAYNLDPEQHWFNLAYPSVAPFNGNRMQICAASFARLASNPTFPVPVGMGCDMTGGSSGGAWIINFSGSSGSMNYVNGNNSYRYTGFGEEIYSPYFGEAAKDLLDYISLNTRLRSDIHIPLIKNSEQN
jgi:hypothetical protein